MLNKIPTEMRLVVLLILLFPISSFSQTYKEMMEDPSVNVYEVVKAAESFFATVDKEAKGSGWMGYQRWLFRTEPLYYPSGDRSQADPQAIQKAYLDFRKKFPPQDIRSNEDEWKDLGPYTANNVSGHYSPGLGRVEEVWVDPNNTNTMYFGSRSGGFWRSFDGGLSWENTTDFLVASGVDLMTVNPNDPLDILINVRHASNGTTMGVYRSLDGGTTWNTTVFTPDLVGIGGLGTNGRVFDVEFSPYNSNHIFIAATGKLFRSTDNLSTLQEVSNNGYLMIEFHASNPNIIFAPREYYWSRNEVFSSNDGGTTWSLLHDISDNNNNSITVATTPADTNLVFFASNAYIWKSDDNGNTIDTIPGSNNYGSEFEVSDTDENIMINGKIDIFQSIDGGSTWSTVTDWYFPAGDVDTNYVHADLRYAKAIDGVFYCGTDGYMVKGTNNGLNWEILNDGVGIRENYRLGVSQSDITRVVCGSQDNGTSIYQGENNEWLEWIGADGMEGLIHPLDSDIMIGSIQNGNKRLSTNGGYTTIGINNHPNIGSLNWVAPVFFDPLNHYNIYTVGQTVHRSDNFGVAWKAMHSFAEGSFQHLVKSENDGNIMLASKGSSLYQSFDNGASFTQVGLNELPNHSIEDIVFDPTNDNNVILVYGQYQDNNSRIYKSEDGGTTWSNISFNLSAMPAHSAAIDHTGDKNIYIGAETGVYKMPWNGSNYELWSTNLPTVAVYELEIMYATNTLRAVTWGRGLWERCLNNRISFPRITKVSIDAQISGTHPMENEAVTLSAIVDDPESIEDMYIMYSFDSIALNQTLGMLRLNANEYQSNGILPQGGIGDWLYFKIFAINTNGDTTESYRYMYEIRIDGDICEAIGSGNTGSDYINSVELNGITKNSSQEYYADFTSTIFDLEQFETYVLDVGLNYHFEPDTVYAWVDWDNSKSFDEDELLYFTMLDNNHHATTSIKVPGNTVVGSSVIMRVRSQYWNSSAQACGSATGEVEDYTITISEGCAQGEMVENLNDFGPGSLRFLIENTCLGDTIYISPFLEEDSLIVYNQEIVIAEDVTIIGLVNYGFTISGNGERRIFKVNPDAELSLQDLKLIDALEDPDGGAILNLGALILQNIEFKGNQEGVNGKAFTNYGEVTIKPGISIIKD